MKLYSGNRLMVLLAVTVCCLLLFIAPTGADPLPGKTQRTLGYRGNDKKATPPMHSLGSGARMAMTGGGILGGIFSAL
ncbi:uncharacterized protein LOC121590538 [Anopheles merus]|uniref:Uncharacterized protein n=1 Tax=Anopheles merus TaxID=30066 RepID=A0A182UQL7_ANOME|nr:uncharacterized protein LOC121590538 [Anopheles merus]